MCPTTLVDDVVFQRSLVPDIVKYQALAEFSFRYDVFPLMLRLIVTNVTDC